MPKPEALIPVLQSVPLGNPELPAPPGYNSLLRSRGNFPESTLEMGVRLCKEFGASLLILVDDVYFKRSNRLPVPDGPELAKACAELAAQGLPETWREMVADINLLRDTSRMPPRDFFTENRLNRRFSEVKSVMYGASCDAEGCNCSETAL